MVGLFCKAYPPYVLAVPPVPVVARAVPVAWRGRVQVVAKWLVCVVNGTDSPRGYQMGAELECDARHKKTFANVLDTNSLGTNIKVWGNNAPQLIGIIKWLSTK